MGKNRPQNDDFLKSICYSYSVAFISLCEAQLTKERFIIV